MDDLKQTIEGLNGFQVAEAVKNLRLSLQYHWKHELEDEDVKQALRTFSPEGNAQLLRDAIVSEQAGAEEMERWGKSLLLFLGADSELREYVEEAVADALKSSVKDFGIATLLIIGAVLVLLKWRPKKLKKGKAGLSIEWEDNDVSAVSDLAKVAAGTPQ
ncbi:MAG TPA: hypothetical protein VGN90_15315 [Pyrinomonadaceae bacterium]|jgi:hypothetical protein|nr:hypothetical protein [Pyrinomonadaceae bacterium]